MILTKIYVIGSRRSSVCLQACPVHPILTNLSFTAHSNVAIATTSRTSLGLLSDFYRTSIGLGAMSSSFFFLLLLSVGVVVAHNSILDPSTAIDGLYCTLQKIKGYEYRWCVENISSTWKKGSRCLPNKTGSRMDARSCVKVKKLYDALFDITRNPEVFPGTTAFKSKLFLYIIVYMHVCICLSVCFFVCLSVFACSYKTVIYRKI